MRVESNFKQQALSYKGAQGLMQIMPKTAKWLLPKMDIEDSIYTINDPELNIKTGIHYLVMMEQQFGNTEDALTAYNRGPNKVRRERTQGIVRTEYMEKVMKYYKELQ